MNEREKRKKEDDRSKMSINMLINERHDKKIVSINS